MSILLIKNPAGANEVLRTLTLEDGELDLLAILNDRTADGKDISWVWDADFELLAPRVRTVTCAGTRAAELALRMKYAGVPVQRLRVVPELAGAFDRALAETPSGRLFVLPTYTALLELREELAARGHLPRFWEARPVSVIWHDLECGAYAEDLPLWRSLADEHGDPVLDVGAGTGRVALDLARHGHRVTALDPEPELIAELERRAAGLDVTGVVADARDFELVRAVRAVHRADADDPAARGARGTHRVPAPRRPRAVARRRAGGRDRRRCSTCSRSSTAAPRRCPTSASSTASSTRASRPRSAPTPTGSCSSGGASGSRSPVTGRSTRTRSASTG